MRRGRRPPRSAAAADECGSGGRLGRRNRLGRGERHGGVGRCALADAAKRSCQSVVEGRLARADESGVRGDVVARDGQIAAVH